MREALWGKDGAFDEMHPLYEMVRRLARVRAAQPALRYGRFYFRPLSGDGLHFGASPYPGGVIAFSRILNDQEILVVANTSATSVFRGVVIVDASLQPEGTAWDVLFSSNTAPTGPDPVRRTSPVEIHEVDGRQSAGPAHVLPVTLGPVEIQILGRPLD